jgi:hypothetical protein
MADLAGIGQMLQGIGAGFSGQGPQYMYAKQQEQEAALLADDRRKAAMLQDLTTVNYLGQLGRWDSAKALLEDRLKHINTLGGDPYHTAGLLDMVKDPARQQEFLDETGAFIAAGEKWAGGSQQASPMQFGPGSMGKDEAGNLWQITQARNPNTGQAETVMSPVGHSNPQQGGMQIVGTMGMTPGESIDYRGTASSAEAQAREAAQTAAAFPQGYNSTAGQQTEIGRAHV